MQIETRRLNKGPSLSTVTTKTIKQEYIKQKRLERNISESQLLKGHPNKVRRSEGLNISPESKQDSNFIYDKCAQSLAGIFPLPPPPEKA